MKKNTIMLSLVSLMSISLLTGCNLFNNNSMINNSSSTINKKLINEEMKLLNAGVKFSIEVKQNLKFLDKIYGEYTNKKETHNLSAEIIYQGGELKAFSSKVKDSYLDGFEYDKVDMCVFEGKDGGTYYKELNYDNTVNTYAYEQDGILVNYNYYCVNPFGFISEDDFIKLNENTYSLSKSKSAFFASYVLGDIDDAFFGVIDKCEFVFDGKDLKEIKVVPHPSQRQRTEGYSNVYYMLEQEVILSVIDKGSNVKVNEVKPNEPKDTAEIEKLATALKNLKKDNYTLDLEVEFKGSKMEVLEEGEEKEYAYHYGYATYFYTGTDLYHSSRQEKELPATPSADNDMLLYDVGKEKLAAYGYSEADSVNGAVFTQAAGSNFSQINNVATYEEITPKLNEVNANIFNYNSEKGCYSICESMETYIASIAIVPPFTTFAEYLYDYGTGLDIYLGNDGNIDRIEFSFMYHEGYTYLEGNSVIKFSNIGTTVLPYNLTVK